MIIIVALAMIHPRDVQAQEESIALSPHQESAFEELLKTVNDIESLTRLRGRIDGLIKEQAVEKLLEKNNLPYINVQHDARIIEFSDYQCGYCKRMFPILQERAVGMRIVELPILGEMSYVAAQYALAARQQNLYEAFHIALMQNQQRLTLELIEEIAQKAGLDIEQLRLDSKSEDISDQLRENYRFAQWLGVRGTPFLIVDKTLRPGAIDREELDELLSSPPADEH